MAELYLSKDNYKEVIKNYEMLAQEYDFTIHKYDKYVISFDKDLTLKNFRQWVKDLHGEDKGFFFAELIIALSNYGYVMDAENDDEMIVCNNKKAGEGISLLLSHELLMLTVEADKEIKRGLKYLLQDINSLKNDLESK